MTARGILQILPAIPFALVQTLAAQTGEAGSFTKVAERSRHLADAGKWDEAKTVLADELIQPKDPAQEARLKAELAHLEADRSTYFHKNESSVLAALKEARTAVQATGDKLALATLEMAEGRFTYWKALDKTNDWGPPTEDFDRGLQIYKELGDQAGLGEALFYRGLVYQMQGQNLHAREMFDQALQLTNKTGDERLRSFVVRHIGYLQQTAGEIDAARANFQKSLQLRQRNEMNVFVPFALLALAEFEAEQKNLAEAMRLVEQAIPLAESGNSPRALYSAQLTLAKWYADAGKTAKAKELAEQSRAGAAAFGNSSDRKKAEDFLREHAQAENPDCGIADCGGHKSLIDKVDFG
jgi:tetratricopeptide (TPR) repeat protein